MATQILEGGGSSCLEFSFQVKSRLDKNWSYHKTCLGIIPQNNEIQCWNPLLYYDGCKQNNSIKHCWPVNSTTVVSRLRFTLLSSSPVHCRFRIPTSEAASTYHGRIYISTYHGSIYISRLLYSRFLGNFLSNFMHEDWDGILLLTVECHGFENILLYFKPSWTLPILIDVLLQDCVFTAVIFLKILSFSYCNGCMLDPICGFCYKLNKSSVVESSCVPVNEKSTMEAAWGRYVAFAVS